MARLLWWHCLPPGWRVDDSFEKLRRAIDQSAYFGALAFPRKLTAAGAW